MNPQNNPTSAPESKESGHIDARSSPVTSNDNRPANLQITSLLNFDPNGKNKRFLNSPRSLEALKRLCLEEHELLAKKKEEFVGQPVPMEFADDKNYFWEVKAEHYEKRRKEKLKLALQERADIIKEEHKKVGGSTTYTTNYGEQDRSASPDEPKTQSFYHSNLLDQGNKKIQQMRNQQKKEIEFIMQNDMKVQEMYKKNEEKMARLQEMEQRRQIENEQKQRLAEIAKQRRLIQKQEREKEQEAINKIIAQKYKEEEERRREIQEKIKEERALEVLKREHERKAKTVVREKRVESIEVQKREYVEKKKEEREARFVKIKEEIEEKLRRKQQESVKIRKSFERKIEAVKQRAELEKEDQRLKMLERQSVTISKRDRIEEEKRIQLDERRHRSEVKVKEIRKALDEKFVEEQSKKASYLWKYQQAEENKKLREMELEQLRKMKIQMEAEKEQKIKQVLAENEKEKAAKNSQFAQHLNEEQIRAQQKKDALIQDLKKKYITDILKMEDARENNERLEKVREKKRAYFLQKIAEDTEKLQQYQVEKEKAFLEKKKLITQLEQEKAQVLKDFEKRKKNLIHHNINNKTSITDLSCEVKGDSLQQNTSKNIQASQSQKKLPMLGDVKVGARSAKNINGKIGETSAPQEPNSSINLGRASVGELRRPNQSMHFEKPRSDSLGPKNLQISPYVRTHKVGNNNGPKGSYPANSPSTHQVHRKEDVVISELHSKVYQNQIGEVRTQHLNKLLTIVTDAVQGDIDMKKLESNMQNIVAVTKQQEEEVGKVRTQNNYLVFA